MWRQKELTLNAGQNVIKHGRSNGLRKAVRYLSKDRWCVGGGGEQVCVRQTRRRDEGSLWVFIPLPGEQPSTGGEVRWVKDSSGTPAAALPGAPSSLLTQPPSALRVGRALQGWTTPTKGRDPWALEPKWLGSNPDSHCLPAVPLRAKMFTSWVLSLVCEMGMLKSPSEGGCEDYSQKPVR